MLFKDEERKKDSASMSMAATVESAEANKKPAMELEHTNNNYKKKTMVIECNETNTFKMPLHYPSYSKEKNTKTWLSGDWTCFFNNMGCLLTAVVWLTRERWLYVASFGLNLVQN